MVPLLVLVPLVLALDRAVMVDDTLFLKAAAQIRVDPLRPFDFAVNWYGWQERFWDVFKNPPGLAYWLAGVEALGGSHEIALHVSMLPFTVAAIVAGAVLARRFAAGSPWATAAWAWSPAFVVSAATLMADVPSLALTLSGLALWIAGIDRDRSSARRLGALVAGAAVVVKYTSIIGVATLALYTLLRRRQGRRLLDLAPAAIVPVAWAALTIAVDGRVHVIDALTVGGGGFSPNPGWFAHRAIALLTFVAGAGVFPIAFVVPAIRRHRWVLGVGAVAGIVATALTPRIWSPAGLAPGVLPLVGVLAAVGAVTLVSVLVAALSRRDPDTGFLALWLGLHVVYLWLWSWTLAARFVLPLMVPLALLLARSLGDRLRAGERGRRYGVLPAAAIVALAAAIVVLRADGFAGEVPRRIVPAIGRRVRAEGRPVRFVGAWGFQHYAERSGVRRLDVRAPDVMSGEILLQPYYAANRELPEGLAGRLEEVASIPAPAPPLGIQTMNINVGAGFYSSAYGPVPWVVARLPAEGVLVWRVR